MRFVLFFLLPLLPLLASGQSSLLTGTVRDDRGLPLEGAAVSAGGARALSDRDGRFRLLLTASGQTLTVTHIGYLPFSRSLTVREGDSLHIDAVLVGDTRPGEEVVVSASLRPEKRYEAAAAIHVVDRKTFERFAGSNPLEVLVAVPGLEYTRNGVDEITFNARGLHSAFNNRVLQIIDGRNSMSALSGTLPVMNRSTVHKDDIERIEVVLGPQSAIWGPNAHNLVFHLVTRDPRKHPGTTLSASAGSQSQFSTRLRHAGVINSRWAYKLTGEQARGTEYRFYDSVYAGNQTGATPFYGPPVAIPERIQDFSFQHLRGEAALYYTLRPGTDIVVSGGSSEHSSLQVTTAGRNRMQGVIYAHSGVRLQSPRWSAGLYHTWGSLGSSYNIGSYTRDYWNRTRSTLPSSDLNRGQLSPDSAEVFAMRIGNRFREKSRRWNGELRYQHPLPDLGLLVAASLQYQEERPNGFGVTLVDSFERIRVRQYGGALQAEKELPFGLRLVAATRLDHHENFGSFVSPRAGLVKTIPGGAFRIGWSRAYSMPTIQNQYAGINRILFGNGEGVLYLPNGRKFSDASQRVTTMPLSPERISTWEAGFKGRVRPPLYLDINGYYGRSRNFVSPPRTVGGRVFAANGIPVTHNPATAGAVVNDTLRNASFSTYFNYGAVTAYGVDLALRYALHRRVHLQLNYSWFGSDITADEGKNDANRDGYVSLEETSLNAPRHRGLLGLHWEGIAARRWNASLLARFVERYDFYSGSQIGTEAGAGRRGVVYGGPDPVTGAPRNYVKNFNRGALGGFTTVDLNTGYDFSDALRLNLGVTNLFDTRQVEFVGAPSIGRLVMVELRVHVR